MDEPCGEQIQRLMELARQALAASRRDLDADDSRGAASRAYYACFYAACALLEAKGVTPRKHSGVISLVGLYFGKTHELDPELTRALHRAFRLRQRADYEVMQHVTREEAEAQISVAERLMRAAQDWLAVRGFNRSNPQGG